MVSTKLVWYQQIWICLIQTRCTQSNIWQSDTFVYFFFILSDDTLLNCFDAVYKIKLNFINFKKQPVRLMFCFKKGVIQTLQFSLSILKRAAQSHSYFVKQLFYLLGFLIFLLRLKRVEFKLCSFIMGSRTKVIYNYVARKL